MLCPRCDSKNVEIVDSRHYKNTTRRRRECQDCKVRFNTLEVEENEYKYLKLKESVLSRRD